MDYKIVVGELSGCPILLLSRGYAYLRSWRSREAGVYCPHVDRLRNNKPYRGKLTDEEEALAMRLILEHS